MASNATLNLTIASTLQKAGFTEAAEHMRQMQKELDNTKKKSSGLSESIAGMLPAITAAAVILFFKKSADAAGEAEQQQLLLQTAVENTGRSWAREKEQINATNEALSANSRFSKGELDTALQVLIQRTNSLTVSQANLQTVMGISIHTGRSLADVSDQVGRAANGSQRDVMQLAKEFGIAGANAKNADFVLAKLADRFGSLSTKTDDYVSIWQRLKNALGDFSETLGNGIIKPFEWAFESSIRLVKVMTSLLKVIGDIGSLAVGSFSGDMKKVGVTLDKLYKDLQAGDDALWGRTPELIKKHGALTTANAHKLSDELLGMMRQFNDETAKLDAERGKNAFQQIKADADAQIAQLQRLDAFKIASEQEQARLILAIRRNQAAKERQIEEQTAKERMQTAINVGHVIGVATGKMLMGDQNAWKDASANIIDMIVQVGEAAVLTHAVEAYWKEIGMYGWAGVASGAGLLIKGAAAAAGIAALGELAKGALGAGGSSAVSTPSGGGGGDGGAPAPTAAGDSATTGPARGTTNLRIVVMGDMVNDQAYIDRLAAKITSAVEDRDVRLVSTSTQRG